MQRREFLAASAGASFLPVLGSTQPAGGSGGEGLAPPPRVLELRKYTLRFGPMLDRLEEYHRSVLVPALGRAGVGPIGAFTTAVGPEAPTLYLLLPHPDAESVLSLAARLAADPEYRSGSAAFRSLPASDPPYVRRDSRLLVPFPAFPRVDAEAASQAGPSRLFELRTYESHNEDANARKVAMFEKEGEIGIFRRVGLNPVFFGQGVVGASLPSLTYLLVFADADAREKAWAAFSKDGEWQRLRSRPGRADAEIVSNISSEILKPTGYSRI